MTIRALLPVLAYLDPTSGTDLKSMLLFGFLFVVLGTLGWFAWTKAPSPLNWIFTFVIVAAALILGFRFIQSL